MFRQVEEEEQQVPKVGASGPEMGGMVQGLLMKGSLGSGKMIQIEVKWQQRVGRRLKGSGGNKSGASGWIEWMRSLGMLGSGKETNMKASGWR